MTTPETSSSTSPGGSALSSRWNYAIDASMGAHQAVAIILETLLRAMADAEPGVVEGREAEYLHDYRVAVRRTRSALSLFGELLPAVVLRRGRRFFKDLGRRTTAARDLDVLQLALPGYAEELGQAGRTGLAQLERRIARESRREYQAIRRWLEGKTYRRGMVTWRVDLGALEAIRENTLMTRSAAAAIRRAAERAGRPIGAAATDDGGDSLHRLRIRFKKLRYALEFSSALTPAGEVDRVIGILKQLQDRLGVHQDLAVHEKLIPVLCESPESEPTASRFGRRLIEVLAQRRKQSRMSFEADSAVMQDQLERELQRALTALIGG